jgi:hypothetical protein
MKDAPINGPRGLADMRDVAALREVVDREARIAQLREENAALFRAEVRAFVARTEEELRAARTDRGTMLRHLSHLVDVPAERETLSPPTWQGRLGTWLARPASTRAVLALAAAGVLATLSGCVALMGVH